MNLVKKDSKIWKSILFPLILNIRYEMLKIRSRNIVHYNIFYINNNYCLKKFSIICEQHLSMCL